MKTYKKECGYSYALGAFPTFELIKNRPDKARAVFYHERLSADAGVGELFDMARKNNIPLECDSRLCEKLSQKENTFVVGVFDKYSSELERGANHIMLVNPSDMGNLGTVMRTALGFGFCDIAVVGEHADFFNPKTIRSSMGSFFSLRVQEFDNFERYAAAHGNMCFPFMLGAKAGLGQISRPNGPFTLVFGNESSGLPSFFESVGTPVKIEHSGKIDSLNLPVAAALAMFWFYR